MKKKRIMLDIETLGTRPGSVILAIGAVMFCPELGIMSTFYRRIDTDSWEYQNGKFRIDAATVKWWMGQSEGARLELLEQADSTISVALLELKEWMESVIFFDSELGRHKKDPDEVWGNGPSFDNAHLQEAAYLCGEPPLWPHQADRCYRTVAALSDIPRPQMLPGQKHHALADATAQALHLIAIFRDAAGLPPLGPELATVAAPEDEDAGGRSAAAPCATAAETQAAA